MPFKSVKEKGFPSRSFATREWKFDAGTCVIVGFAPNMNAETSEIMPELERKNFIAATGIQLGRSGMPK